jgi:hypothetical protein
MYAMSGMMMMVMDDDDGGDDDDGDDDDGDDGDGGGVSVSTAVLCSSEKDSRRAHAIPHCR